MSGLVLEKLLRISSQPILAARPVPLMFESLWSRPLEHLLTQRNGFFAFESALHVYPSGEDGASPLLEDWNSPKGWRASYPDLDSEAICFAQDVFVNQFVLSREGVSRLNPETAEVAPHSENLADWAAKLLADYSYETGWELAQLWQRSQRPLRPGERLVPRRPFVLGGDYEVENLVAVESYKAMGLFARLSAEIRAKPEGASVTLEGWIA